MKWIEKAMNDIEKNKTVVLYVHYFNGRFYDNV